MPTNQAHPCPNPKSPNEQPTKPIHAQARYPAHIKNCKGSEEPTVDQLIQHRALIAQISRSRKVPITPLHLQCSVLLAASMEHADDHEDDVMQVEVAPIQIIPGPIRYKNKKRSKVWEEYKPVFSNGKVRSAECRYCHNRLSCKDSNGTSHLWRHQKICPAKLEVAQRQQKDVYFSYVMINENEPASQSTQESLDRINFSTSNEKSRFKSKVWKEFRPIYIEGRLQSADCIHCHKRLSANKFSGRSHLNRHLQTCSARPSSLSNLKSRVQDELSPALTNGKVQIAEYSNKLLGNNSSGGATPRNQQIQAFAALDGTSSQKQVGSYLLTASPEISNWKFDQEASDHELTKMVILHGYPLSIGEHEEMRRFATSLNPMFNMASHATIEEHCNALFQKEKANLKEKIALSCRRVSLSASVWTPDEADPRIKYLCLTAHFIDKDWKVHRRIIKFGVLWSSPTDLERMIHCKESCVLDSESGLYNVMWDAISDWNLDGKLLSLTSVGEIRNDDNFSRLKDVLMGRSRLPIRELHNIVCLDDVLNSIISKVHLDMLHVVGDVTANFFLTHTSSSGQQQVIEFISQLDLKCPGEDAKWWHKIYFRLEVLLHFKKAFPSDELVSPEETKLVECVCKILRVFYRAIEVISGSSCPTSNIYFNELWKVRTTLQEEASNDHNVIASMVREMQEALNACWQNSYLWLSIPVVLDPRFKMGFIEFRLKRAFGADASKYMSNIQETMRELFDEYCNPTVKVGAGTGDFEGCDAEVDADDSDSLEDWDQHLNAQARNQMSTELEKYFQEGLVPRKDEFNILNWWMSHSTKYPTLAVMAGDILAIPASAVQSEAAFSCKGPVIPKHHSTLNIKTIEGLVCARDWMR